MKTMIIIPPCEDKPTSFPPYGGLYIGTCLKNYGNEAELLNLDLLRYETGEVLKCIGHYAPDIIGFSAIVSNSYRYIKELSKAIKVNFPDVFMILGGQLSNAANVVLSNTPIDVVVIGEGEKTIIRLIESLKNGSDIKDINGIAFKNYGKVVYTPPVKLIKNLDELPSPDYELIDMDFYLWDPIKRFEPFLNHIKDTRFREPKRLKQKAFTIMTGRGCHARCTFCCRNIRGLRKFSAEYLLDLIEILKDKYNVGYFTFGDESFIFTKKWTLDFLEKLNRRNLDILFYVLGARVDRVDKEVLSALKDSGCFMIEYGYETGSQRMLDMIEKRVTVAENYRAHLWTIEADLYTVPANIINMPGETPESINKTIQFLKSLKMDDPQIIVKYAQAHPGTPLYEYALLTGLIKDEDEYLTNISEINPGDLESAYKKEVLLNFSGQTVSEVLSWSGRIYHEVRYDAYRREKGILVLLILIRDKIFTRVFVLVKRLFKYGFIETTNLYYKKINSMKKTFFQGLSKKKYLNKSNSYTINQLRFIDQDLINKIKKQKYTSRKIVKNPQNKHIDYYLDQIDGHMMIRYPSLRKVCQSIRESSMNPAKE